MSVTFTAQDPTTGEFVSTEAMEINMANGNAATVLEVLGLDAVELMGGEPADAFLGRVLMAMAVSPEDAGVPAHTAVDNARWIECGRRPGYVQERLEQRHALAEFAKGLGAEVCWT